MTAHADAGPRHQAAVLAGATGLVGGECLKLLLADPAFSRVVVIARRPAPETLRDSKLAWHVLDFESLAERRELFHADAVFSALGTTRRHAPTRERYRRIDHDYPLAIARLALAEGATHFLLVSSLGASARSRYSYARLKGELDEAILALPYRSVTIARPSLLLGERGEFRLGEEIAKRTVLLWPRRFWPRRFQPVTARAVAAALLNAAKEDKPGHRIIMSQEIAAAT
jgi:uncharacterized protein YbjT (DUF2867 family)